MNYTKILSKTYKWTKILQNMKKQPKVDNWILAIGILCITFLMSVALCLGYNGQRLQLVLIIIAGLVGWVIPNPKVLKK